MPSAAATERLSRAVERGPGDPPTGSEDDDGHGVVLSALEGKDPKWKLDRRASGHLFWRRDSAAFPDNASRVKFRYDVQVVEYEDGAEGQAGLVPADEAEEDAAVDSLSDSEDSSSSSSGAEGAQPGREEQRALRRRRRAKAKARRRLSDTSTAAAAASSSVLVCFLCVALIVVVMSYQWLLVE